MQSVALCSAGVCLTNDCFAFKASERLKARCIQKLSILLEGRADDKTQVLKNHSFSVDIYRVSHENVTHFKHKYFVLYKIYLLHN